MEKSFHGTKFLNKENIPGEYILYLNLCHKDNSSCKGASIIPNAYWSVCWPVEKYFYIESSSFVTFCFLLEAVAAMMMLMKK